MKKVPKSGMFAMLGVISLLIALGSQSSFLSEELHPRIFYRIHVDAADLTGFDVEMQVRSAGETVRIAMASHPEYDDHYWRYVENLTAESRGARLQVKRDEDALWSVAARGGNLTIKYRIHLPPQTTPIRDAWKPFLTPTGGLIGDLHSFMYIVGAESAPASVTLDLPSGWAAASGLDHTNDPQTFTATTVELLLDSPIIVGQYRTWDFNVGGVPHQVVYLPQPNAAVFDTISFIAGIQKLVAEAIKIAGKPTYHKYTFLYQDGADGALEHLNSVTIGAKSQNLAKGLVDVFEMTAHEYFHTWNLMHVRPRERVGLHYRPADPTGELWWSEGLTIFFSDVMLRRAALPVHEATRKAHLERDISRYLSTPGYSTISAERASRAADDPFSLGDNFASTHLQGSLLGTMLDLMIRHETQGRRSIDNVMRILSGRFTPRRGITGSDIERVVHEVCSCDAHTFFETHVRGALALDFDRYLRLIGLRMNVSWLPVLNSDGKPEPDMRISAIDLRGDQVLKLRLTNPNSVWARAGLHTGDRLVSVDGRPVATTADFRSWLGKLKVGDTARVEVIRDGTISTLIVLITGYDRPTVRIDEIVDATPEQRRLLTQWLAAAP